MEEKTIKLGKCLKSLKRVMVAYSGGLDSTYLLAMSAAVLGRETVCAATSAGPALSEQDRADAVHYAGNFGVKHVFLDAGEINDRRYTENSNKRCYWCKRNLFQTMSGIAKEMDMVIIDGFHADDRNDYRPGKLAGDEFGVHHPLDESSFTKEDIRAAARRMGLACWNKPDSPCLASRVPHGKTVTPAVLLEIDKIERTMRGFDFRVVRARHFGGVVRIEVGQDEIKRLNDEKAREAIVEAIRNSMDNGSDKEILFDPQGYRRGNCFTSPLLIK